VRFEIVGRVLLGLDGADGAVGGAGANADMELRDGKLTE
jgi:hypothetical protein